MRSLYERKNTVLYQENQRRQVKGNDSPDNMGLYICQKVLAFDYYLYGDWPAGNGNFSGDKPVIQRFG